MSFKLDQCLLIETLKIKKAPLIETKKIFVSNFTQILCVQPLDNKDFKFSVSSKKFFSFFFPNARGPPKILDVQFFKNFMK